jgi:hypothetical protein
LLFSFSSLFASHRLKFNLFCSRLIVALSIIASRLRDSCAVLKFSCST